MLNLFLLPFAVMAETLDAVTIDWARESNPFVLFLGPWAYVGKAVIIFLLVWLALNVRDVRTTFILLFAVALGLFGAYTNLNGGIG